MLNQKDLKLTSTVSPRGRRLGHVMLVLAALPLLLAGGVASLATAPEAQAAPACAVLDTGAHTLANRAVNEACDLIGTPYSWGGGHGSTPGPTYGQCDPANGAPNDCNVRGLDCSGLTRYAYYRAVGSDILGSGPSRDQWSSSRAVARFSASQGTGPLLPGDLVFYGTTAATIHHVAIYIGDGYMVEAPESGSNVRVAAVLGSGREDYLGAIRLYEPVAGSSARPMRDYDRDGKSDLFTRKADGTYVFYRGTGDGRFYGITKNGGWNNYNLIEGIGDHTGDGNPDLVARNKYDGTLHLYRGTGGGGFGNRELISGGWDNFNLIEGVGDLNSDGLPDLFARKTDGTYWYYRGTADHGFWGTEMNGGWNNFDLIEGTGDITGDNRPDLVARNKYDGTLKLYTGYAGGSFGNPAHISGGWDNFNTIEGIGDANGDNRPDLFARNKNTGKYWLYRGTADHGFWGQEMNGGWDTYTTITQ